MIKINKKDFIPVDEKIKQERIILKYLENRVKEQKSFVEMLVKNRKEMYKIYSEQLKHRGVK